MKNVNISQKQASEFARTILADIDVYIQAHQEEFEVFLKEEEQRNEGRQ